MNKRPDCWTLVLALSSVWLLHPSPGSVQAEKKAPEKAHFDPVIKKIEGWTVHVDPKLLEGDHAEEGARALNMLANHLQRIAALMPEDRLEKMQKLELWIAHDHPDTHTEPVTLMTAGEPLNGA